MINFTNKIRYITLVTDNYNYKSIIYNCMCVCVNIPYNQIKVYQTNHRHTNYCQLIGISMYMQSHLIAPRSSLQKVPCIDQVTIVKQSMCKFHLYHIHSYLVRIKCTYCLTTACMPVPQLCSLAFTLINFLVQPY